MIHHGPNAVHSSCGAVRFNTVYGVLKSTLWWKVCVGRTNSIQLGVAQSMWTDKFNTDIRGTQSVLIRQDSIRLRGAQSVWRRQISMQKYFWN